MIRPCKSMQCKMTSRENKHQHSRITACHFYTNLVDILSICFPCSAYFCLVVCLLNLLCTISWLCPVLHRLNCRGGSSLWVCIWPSFPDQWYSLTELGYSRRNSHFIHKETRQDLVLNSKRFKGTKGTLTSLTPFCDNSVCTLNEWTLHDLRCVVKTCEHSCKHIALPLPLIHLCLDRL